MVAGIPAEAAAARDDWARLALRAIHEAAGAEKIPLPVNDANVAAGGAVARRLLIDAIPAMRHRYQGVLA
jgi:hypothetical protein